MPSMIRLICPNLKCRKILTVPQTARGKIVRCRNCGIKISIPTGAPTPPPAPAPATSPSPAPGDAATDDDLL